ncbi:unnamed protein product [Rotaria sp. Silwood2]|nr:unnamed protein product [Rotaria sp. Silwood2]CAF4285259.1 unnamed protein product [Rotaria sp. Silwood2]
MTSHSLPDECTGMTGMERSFQLLNSASCWSSQAYDPLSLNILCQIAMVSPKATYYPENLICMEQIDWNSHDLPYFVQHCDHYLIAKELLKTSE